MTFHAGPVPAGTSLYIPFTTYAGSTGASATCTGLAVTDVEIYKNGSTTQRASDAGIALLDTDGIDFDGITGLHGFSIDLSDNTDASFYAVGSWYWVVVSAITVDSQTVTFLAATFRIAPAESITGYPKTDQHALKGDAQSATDLQDFADAGYDPSTNKVQGVVLVDTLTTYTSNTPQTGDTYALANGVTGFVAIDTVVDAIKAKTDNLPTDPADQSAVDAAITAATSPLATAANLATVAGYLDTEIAAILADTNELQTDWANGGRLDLILDARASQTSVDDIPTNAELATALATGVNVTQIDGSNLGTHGIGQFPADVRDWGGLGATIAIDADNSAPSVAVSHIHDDVISAASVSAAAAAKLADISRRRTQANVEASSDGDALSIGSLYGLIQQAQESNAVDSAGYLTIYKTDGSTSLGTKVLSTNAAADPVDGIS